MTPSTSPTIVLYDGWCSVCSKSADKLRTLDRGRGVLKAIDLRSDTQILDNHNLKAGDVRRVMHTITPDGQVHVAMDGLRAALKAVGRGWLIGWTQLPIIRPIADRLYITFADNRHRWLSAQ